MTKPIDNDEAADAKAPTNPQAEAEAAAKAAAAANERKRSRAIAITATTMATGMGGVACILSLIHGIKYFDTIVKALPIANNSVAQAAAGALIAITAILGLVLPTTIAYNVTKYHPAAPAPVKSIG